MRCSVSVYVFVWSSYGRGSRRQVDASSEVLIAGGGCVVVGDKGGGRFELAGSTEQRPPLHGKATGTAPGA